MVVFVTILLIVSCKNSSSSRKYKGIDAFPNAFEAVIEIPAGTNHKIEMNKKTGDFEVDQAAGKDRIIDFLPYPGNYGFINNTLMDKNKGGDGDALDVLILGESIPTGIHLPFIPIAVMMALDRGEKDSKIIGIPADPNLQVMHCENFIDFSTKYNGAKHIIKEWFMNYKGMGKMEFLGWKDEKFARNVIAKWNYVY